MKKTVLFTLFSLFAFSTFAQFPSGNAPQGTPSVSTPKGTATLKGIMLDSITQKPVEFASIALYVKSTNKLIDGTTTDEKGKFALEGIAAGVYKVQISFIGYSDKTLDNVVIRDGQTFDVGKVKLSTSEKLLNEVTITSEKALVEEKVDRTIYNAEKDISSRGGDAADVLRKVPLLSVDLDGNVSIRGSSNIRVLINNKPSTIMASSVADALKQIPADMIKSVEVITSPSAKYDAEGSGGIINIITKKNNLEGYFLNADIGVGNRGSNLGLSGSYRKGKFGATIGGFGRAGYNRAVATLEQTTTRNGVTTLTKQTGDAFDRPLFGHYNLGFDYDLAPNQSLTAGVRFGLRNFTRTQDQTTDLYQNSSLISEQLRDITSKDLSNNVDINLDYLRTFKPQQEWSISTQYSRNNLTNNFFSDNIAVNNEILSRLKNVNLNLNQEITIQTDYQTPLSENQLLEFGAKGIFRQVNSDYEYLTASGSSTVYASDATRPAGALLYSQNVGAAYTSYTLTTKKRYSFKAGLRYEYTSIQAEEENKAAIDIPSYGTLVPSINFSKPLKGSTTIKLGYNRRIQRPGLQQLNPNFNIVNPQSISVGNPALSPEFTDNIELGISTRIKQTFLNIALFGRQTDNAITQIRRASDTLTGAIITTFENIGKQRALGVNLNGNVYLTPNWTVNGGLDIMYLYLEGVVTDANGLSVKSSNDGVAVNGRLMTQLTLKNGWGVQGFGGMRGAQVMLQGKNYGGPFYSIGIRKDFKNKKGSFGLAGENFFTPSTVINRTELNTAQFNQVMSNNIYNRGIRLTLNLKLGKMGFEQKRKTRSVRNDDVKEGDGGGGEGGGMQQGGNAPQGGSRPAQGGQGTPTTPSKTGQTAPKTKN